MYQVAVIGAGVSGLLTTKSLLEEGLNVVCFEESSDTGGLWSFKEQAQDHPTVMSCTIMNTSKEMSAFSDFPPPAHFSNFMHHKQALEYIRLYAERFALNRYIRFQHRVESLKPSDDFATSGRWIVQVMDLISGEMKIETYDSVAVCSGYQSRPHRPVFSGISDFGGRVIHGSAYKNSQIFKDRTVLVVGMGNSGSDVAVDLCGVAKKVYLSTRQGAWIYSRLASGGYPGDLLIFQRHHLFLNSLLPTSRLNTNIENKLNQRVNHDFYGIRPKHRPLAHFPVLNEELHLKLLSGQLQMKGAINRLEKSGVVFQDNQEEVVEVEDVILATGYEVSFPFLVPEDINPLKDGQIDLYKYVFPPGSKFPTLAFGGIVYAFGTQYPVLEMQARWIARVFSNHCQLPSTSVMKRDILANQKRLNRRFDPGLRLLAQVEWLPYLDELASNIGVKPCFWKLLFKDPKLFVRLVFGPALPYTYRLQGSHAWGGARKAIFDLEERITAKLKVKVKTTTYS